MSVSWACSHVLFLALELLTSSENAIFDQKSTRFNNCLWLKEWLLFTFFNLMCNNWARICFNVCQLKIDNKIGNSFEIAHGSGHEIKFLFESIFRLIFIYDFERPPLFIELFHFMSPCIISFVSFNNKCLGIDRMFLIFWLRFRCKLLYQIVNTKRKSSNSCKFKYFLRIDHIVRHLDCYDNDKDIF